MNLSTQLRSNLKEVIIMKSNEMAWLKIPLIIKDKVSLMKLKVF